jgi:hypothetical protein
MLEDRCRCRWALLAVAVSCCAAAAPAPQKVIARIDLSKPFDLPPGASFTATQGAAVPDAYGDAEQEAGLVHLCVQTAQSAPCAPDLDHLLITPGDKDPTAGAHYLEVAEVVHPRGINAAPLLHIQVASIHAGNGSQGRAAVMLAYRLPDHRFEPIVTKVVGGNRNQEIRYIASGPLRDNVITVEPTDDPPFGYWVTVNGLTRDYRYKQVLRYRSATHYGDGNSLAVIESEMPNILRRLRLWRPGQPLPLPKSACARPRLVKTELWCS